jgi:SAM-dependent methyltransferase
MDFDWAQVNRDNWDERVPVHVGSAFYDLEGFKHGKTLLEPFEVEELGPLGELELCHLQCHIGTDMLDMVRMHPGLRGTGYDFSAPALQAASALATEMGLADRVRFVQGDVREAAAVLAPATFDVVYTGKGAICWINDLGLWASQCFSLVRPGGFLYVSEFHPVGYALGEQAPVVEGDYFRAEPWIDEAEGTYADLKAPTVHNRSVCWNHPMAKIIDSLLNAGFELRFLHEYDYTLFPLNSWLVEETPGRFVWPSATARLPLMYSLKAYRQS